MNETTRTDTTFYKVISHKAIERIVLRRIIICVLLAIHSSYLLNDLRFNFSPVLNGTRRLIILNVQAPLGFVDIIGFHKSCITIISSLLNRDIAHIRQVHCLILILSLIILITIIRHLDIPARQRKQIGEKVHIVCRLNHIRHIIRRGSNHFIHHMNHPVAYFMIGLHHPCLTIYQVVGFGQSCTRLINTDFLTRKNTVVHIGNGKGTIRGKIWAFVSRIISVVNDAVFSQVCGLLFCQLIYVGRRATCQTAHILLYCLVCRNETGIISTRLQRIRYGRGGEIGPFGNFHQVHSFENGYNIGEAIFIAQIIEDRRLISDGKIRRVNRLLAPSQRERGNRQHSKSQASCKSLD